MVTTATLEPPATASSGLDGVVAASTRLSHVDGQAGKLILAGYPIEELALRASFEEVIFLLWHDRFPTPEELATLRAELAAARTPSALQLQVLEQAATHEAAPMDALRAALGLLELGMQPPSALEDRRLAVQLIAQTPSLVAAYARLRQQLEPIPPRADLGLAAAFLYQLSGELPSPDRSRALETYLVTVADHGLNASTFAARVIISTGSDMVSAAVGAVGALKGPLHGGAPGPALDTVLEIATPERAEAVLSAKLAAGERLMGFGHRVYRVRDPRAEVLVTAAEQFYLEGSGDRDLFDLARHVEGVALRLLANHRPSRALATNVEFYTALLLHGLNLPTDLFTPVFAVGRMAGWTAHALEQRATGRLIRPAAAYVGAHNRGPLGAR